MKWTVHKKMQAGYLRRACSTKSVKEPLAKVTSFGGATAINNAEKYKLGSKTYRSFSDKIK